LSGQTNCPITVISNYDSGLVSSALVPSLEGREFEPPVGSSQRLENWHFLCFTI